MARRKSSSQDDDGYMDVPPTEPRVLTSDDLDRVTSRGIAELHMNRIFEGDADIGEQELVMMLLHLLHARRYSYDVDALDTRRADFEEQFKMVFT